VRMEAYFDESGIQDGAKVCVVAGYYGSEVCWRRFENQWNKVLADYPEIVAKGFHAKVFFGRDEHNCRVGEYKGWSDDKANKFLERILQTITRNRIFPIGYGVIVDDFGSLPLVSKLWLTGARFSKKTGEVIEGGCPSKSYYLPFQFCVLKSAQQSNATPKGKLHCFAGLDRTFSEYADELFKILLADDRIAPDLRDRLGTISYPLSKETPGIQAADLLTNRLYKRSQWALKNPDSEPRPLLLALVKNWRSVPKLQLMNRDVFMDLEKRGRESFATLKATGELT
jgi:hypothetical protein